MKVAIAVNVISAGARGIPLFQSYLARHLAAIDRDNEYLLFGYLYKDFARRKASMEVPRQPNFRLSFHRWPQRLIDPLLYEYDLPVFWPWLKAAGVEVFHSTSLFTPNVPGVATVTTLHDCCLERLPELGTREGAALIPRWLARADRLVAVSQWTKKDFVELYKVPEQRIEVLRQGVDLDVFKPRAPGEDHAGLRRRLGLPGRFVLSVGPVEPRRNYPTLLRAFAEMLEADDAKDLKLVIAGAPGTSQAEVEALMRALGLSERVVMTGHISLEDLVGLYHEASVFVYPSLFEGFAHPPLEALACGLPVVAADNTALPELLEGCGTLAPTKDARAYAAGALELLRTPGLAAARREAGLARAASLSWRRTAEGYRRIYEDVANSRKRSARSDGARA